MATINWLLVSFAVSNDIEMGENIDANPLGQSETIETTKDNISLSFSDRTSENIYPNTSNDKATVGTSTTSALTTSSTLNVLQPIESIHLTMRSAGSQHDTDYVKNTNGNTPIQCLANTHGDIYSSIPDSSTRNINACQINNVITVGSPKGSETTLQSKIDPIESIVSENSTLSTSSTQYISQIQTLTPIIIFKSYTPDISSQEDIDDELCLPLSYQFMFDKRTSPWEMKDWDQDHLNAFIIQPEKIDRLYHIVANDEDPNFRSWELCCRMDYKWEKYFVEMYANCDYTGFDCQGGGHICITKLADFFLCNMVTSDQNPDEIYKALLEDGYDVPEPDPLHKMHPKFWNNTPMLKYLCHNSIYKHKDILPHFKEKLPQVLANSIDDFIKVKEWENE